MKLTKKLLKTDYYFDGDKEVRNIYRITITNRGKRTSFTFGDSIANTQKGKALDDYSVLACVKGDYFNTKEYYPTFEDFANEFDYSTDSRQGEKVYKQCLKQAEKLHQVFTQEEIEKLPD